MTKHNPLQTRECPTIRGRFSHSAPHHERESDSYLIEEILSYPVGTKESSDSQSTVHAGVSRDWYGEGPPWWESQQALERLRERAQSPQGNTHHKSWQHALLYDPSFVAPLLGALEDASLLPTPALGFSYLQKWLMRMEVHFFHTFCAPTLFKELLPALYATHAALRREPTPRQAPKEPAT